MSAPVEAVLSLKLKTTTLPKGVHHRDSAEASSRGNLEHRHKQQVYHYDNLLLSRPLFILNFAKFSPPNEAFTRCTPNHIDIAAAYLYIYIYLPHIRTDCHWTHP